MVTQEGEREHIIYCGSTGLTDAQRRWSMCELELGSIVFALENAHNFTYGDENIEIFTDHSLLVGLSKKCLDEIPNPRLTALINKIAHYNYRIKHISGENNVPADVLSRLPSYSKDLQDINHFIPVQTITVAAVQTRSTSVKIARDLIDMVARATEDEDYQELIKKIERGVDFDKLGKEDPHRKYAEKWSNLRILKTTGGNLVNMDNLLVPPESERPDLIARSHQSHMNFETIYATQRKHWWWPELKKEIREEWEKCEDCLRCKKSKTQAPPLYPLDAIAYEIGEYSSTDLFEFRGRDFVLGIDKASQLMFIEELKNK